MKVKLDNSNNNGISVIMPTYNQACFIRNAFVVYLYKRFLIGNSS